MPETFRVRVAARRQITLPPRALELLHLEEGDVLEISIDNSEICGGKGLKLVPANLFDEDLIRRLQEREREMDRGVSIKAKNAKELIEKVTRKRANAMSNG